MQIPHIVAIVCAVLVASASGSIVSKWGPLNPQWEKTLSNVKVSILSDRRGNASSVLLIQNSVVDLDTVPIRFAELATFDLHDGTKLCHHNFGALSGTTSSGTVLITGEGQPTVTMWNMRTCTSMAGVNCSGSHHLFAANDEIGVCESSFKPNTSLPTVALTTTFANLTGSHTVQLTYLSTLLNLWMMERNDTVVILGNINSGDDMNSVLSFSAFDVRQLRNEAAAHGPIVATKPLWSVPIVGIPQYMRLFETASGGVAYYYITDSSNNFQLLCIDSHLKNTTFSSGQSCLHVQVEGDAFVCIFNNNYALVVDTVTCSEQYIAYVDKSNGAVGEIYGLQNYGSAQLILVQQLRGTQQQTGFVVLSPQSSQGAQFFPMPSSGHHQLTTTQDFIVVASNTSMTAFQANGDITGVWHQDGLGVPLAAGGDKNSNAGAVIDKAGFVAGFEVTHSPSITLSLTGFIVANTKLCAPLDSNNITVEITTDLVVITVSYEADNSNRVRQTGFRGDLWVFEQASTANGRYSFCLDSGSWAEFSASLEKLLESHEFKSLCFGLNATDQIDWTSAQLTAATSTKILTASCSEESRCQFNRIDQYPTQLQIYKPFGSSSLWEVGKRTVLLSPKRGAWMRTSWPLGECLDVEDLGDFTHEKSIGPAQREQVNSACSAASCAVASCEAAVSVAFQMYWCYLSFGVIPTVETVGYYLTTSVPWIVNNDQCAPALLAVSQFSSAAKVKFVSKNISGSFATFMTNCNEFSATNGSDSKLKPFNGHVALVGWKSHQEDAVTEQAGLQLRLSPCVIWGQGDLIALPYIVIFIGNIIGVVLTVALNALLERTRVRYWIISARVKLLDLMFPSEFTRGEFYKIQSVAKARERFNEHLRYYYTSRIPKSRDFFETSFEQIWPRLRKRRRERLMTVQERCLCDEFFWKTFTQRGTRIATDTKLQANERSNFECTVDVFEALINLYHRHSENPAHSGEAFARLGITGKRLRRITAIQDDEADQTPTLRSLNGSQVFDNGYGSVNSRRSTSPHTTQELREEEYFTDNDSIAPPNSASTSSTHLGEESERSSFDFVASDDHLRNSLLEEDFFVTDVEKLLDRVEFNGGIYLDHDKENAILFSSEAWVLSIRAITVIMYVLYVIVTVFAHCTHCSIYEKYQAIYFRIVNSGVPTGFLMATYLRALVLRFSRLSILFAATASALYFPPLITHFIPGYFKYALVTFPLTGVLGFLMYLFHKITQLPSMPTYRCQRLFSQRFARWLFFSAFDQFHRSKLASGTEGGTEERQTVEESRCRMWTREVMRFFCKALLRIFITFMGTVIMQMSYNYALLTIYSSDQTYFDAIAFDYNSRHVACTVYSLHVWEHYAANKMQVLATLFSI